MVLYDCWSVVMMTILGFADLSVTSEFADAGATDVRPANAKKDNDTCLIFIIVLSL